MNKKNIFFKLFIAIFIIGCGYKQPSLNEPYGIIKASGDIRILEIDGQRAISLDGSYEFRIPPGKHTLILSRGYETDDRRTGKNRAKLSLDIEEGYKYYIEPKLIYGLNNLFFGIGFKEVKSWKPIIKKKERIKKYKNNNFNKKINKN